LKKSLIIMTVAVCMLLMIAEGAQAALLNLGGNYSHIPSIVNNVAKTVGGGSIEPSSLDGIALEYVYCLDLFTYVYVPGVYNDTDVNNAGMIYGNPLNNAGEVAWLLANYGTSGQGDEAKALQAAIWNVIFGYDVYHLDAANNNSNVVNLYNTMLTAVVGQTGPISDFFWMTPGKNSNCTEYQGLVGFRPVPIPPTAYLIASGLIPFIRLRKKR
jgi:hypothetical protein